jgi:hypothetical protein
MLNAFLKEKKVLQEHLLQIIINMDLYSVLMFVLFLWNWFILLKLGFIMNKRSLNNFRLLIFAFSGTICTLLVRAFLPIYFAGFINVLVLSCFFCIGGLKLLNAFFTSFFILMISALGNVLFIQSLFSINTNFIQYLTTDPLGITIGTFIETLLPFLFYLFAQKSKFSLLPFRIESTTSETLAIILFGIIFFAIYHMTTLVLWIYKNIPNPVLRKMILLEYVLVSISGIILYIVNLIISTEKKREMEHEILKELLEQSYLLINTLASKQREVRNQLQVIKAHAELGHQTEIMHYINKIVAESLEINISKIKNPIIYSSLLSTLIQASEKKVPIIVKSKTTLEVPEFNSLKIAEIIRYYLEFLINLNFNIDQSGKVKININEDDESYLFEFINYNPPLILLTNTEPNETFVQYETALIKAENLVKGNNGKSWRILKDNKLTGVKFQIYKRNKKRKKQKINR